MNTRIILAYEANRKAIESWHARQITCPQCAFFTESKNFSDKKIAHFTLREKMRHFWWGLCAYHIDEVDDSLRSSDELHFTIEKELGLEADGYFRKLPDGRTCTIHTNVWRDHLISLASK